MDNRLVKGINSRQLGVFWLSAISSAVSRKIAPTVAKIIGKIQRLKKNPNISQSHHLTS
jgi:hypothetical protein